MPQIQFDSEMVGHSRGQSDFVIKAKIGSKLVGYVEFGVYQGEPSIKYIFVDDNFRRQGIATKLMQQVQRENPDAHINLGMATELGAPFVKSLNRKFHPDEEYERVQDRLKKLKARYAVLQKMSDEFHDNPTDEDREKMGPYWDEMNDVHDEIQSLERDHWDLKPGKWIIDTGFKEWLIVAEIVEGMNSSSAMGLLA